MGTILASAIITKARDILQDVTPVRWTDAEALRWLNEGQRYVTLQRPDASVTVANITLAGGTRQALPAAALRLLDVVRNMGVGGASPGVPVRLVERDVLDTQASDWHGQTSSTSIKHYLYDERNPKIFYVYPPATVNATVEAIYSVAPTDMGTIGTAIQLDDIYEPVLLDYLLYRAFSKDAEYAAVDGRAAMHIGAVNAALGVKTAVDTAVSPFANAPGNPNAMRSAPTPATGA